MVSRPLLFGAKLRSKALTLEIFDFDAVSEFFEPLLSHLQMLPLPLTSIEPESWLAEAQCLPVLVMLQSLRHVQD